MSKLHRRRGLSGGAGFEPTTLRLRGTLRILQTTTQNQCMCQCIYPFCVSATQSVFIQPSSAFCIFFFHRRITVNQIQFVLQTSPKIWRLQSQSLSKHRERLRIIVASFLQCTSCVMTGSESDSDSDSGFNESEEKPSPSPGTVHVPDRLIRLAGCKARAFEGGGIFGF